MSKHLTYDYRLEIQAGLREMQSFAQIDERIGNSRTTVYREVLTRRKLNKSNVENQCIYRGTCNQPQICVGRCPEFFVAALSN